jgi:hypothetical protein
MTDLTVYQPQTELTADMDYARAIAPAALLPAAYRGKPADVLVAVGLGRAIGIPPAQALYEVYVVNGRPSPSANLMAALVRRAGHRLRIDGDATRCTATLIRHDDPDAPFTATWTIEQARAAGLTGKDTWKQYPAAMLRARAIAEVVRMGASEAVLGMDYAREEMQDVEPERAPAPARPTGMDAVRAAVTHRTDAGAAEPPQGNPPGPASEASVDGVRPVDPAPASPKITAAQQRKLFALFKAKGITEEEQLPGIAHVIGRPIESRTAMTPDEFEAVVKQLEARDDALQQDAEAGDRDE